MEGNECVSGNEIGEMEMSGIECKILYLSVESIV